jgi:hypothetical protein
MPQIALIIGNLCVSRVLHADTLPCNTEALRFRSELVMQVSNIVGSPEMLKLCIAYTIMVVYAEVHAMNLIYI